MTARPASLYLAHFDVTSAVHPLAQGVETQELAPVWVPEQEQEDFEAKLAEAREAGRAEAAEAAQLHMDAEIERLREESAAELAAARQKWLEEESAILKDRLATALQQIQDELAECVARILRPFIVESLRRQMVGELVEHVGSLVASHEMMSLKIAGPPDLLATLQAKLGGLPVAVAYEESEGVDVRVVAQQTMIETRLKAWIDLISANKLE